MTLVLVLTAISGISWTIAYIDAIRVGFEIRDKTYAMPVFALGLNLAWEVLYTYLHRADRSAQLVVNATWLICDILIAVTYFRFGRNELPKQLPSWMFTTGALLVLSASFAVQILMYLHFGIKYGSYYSAFLQNLLMSASFIAMLIQRRGLHGQSLTIAVAKWLGTIAPTILFGIMEDSLLVTGVGFLIFVLDITYIGLVLWVRNDPLF